MPRRTRSLTSGICLPDGQIKHESVVRAGAETTRQCHMSSCTDSSADRHRPLSPVPGLAGLLDSRVPGGRLLLYRGTAWPDDSGTSHAMGHEPVVPGVRPWASPGPCPFASPSLEGRMAKRGENFRSRRQYPSHPGRLRHEDRDKEALGHRRVQEEKRKIRGRAIHQWSRGASSREQSFHSSLSVAPLICCFPIQSDLTLLVSQGQPGTK